MQLEVRGIGPKTTVTHECMRNPRRTESVAMVELSLDESVIFNAARMISDAAERATAERSAIVVSRRRR